MSKLISVALADDSAEVRSLVRARLRLSKRFDVVGEASTGVEAVDLVLRADPDLLLLDVSMPGMDGLDALVRIREEAPRTVVVMFSGFEEHGLADRARQLGAADFIAKSVAIETLAGRLGALVDPPTGAEIGTPEPPPAAVPDLVLQEHLERFRAAFDRAAIGMATLTLTGRVVRGNAAFADLVAQQTTLVGTHYSELVDDVDGGIASAIEDVASGQRDEATIEHRLLSGPTVLSTLALVRDSGQQPLYLLLQVQNLSERRTAEEELRRSEERFRLLVDSVQDYAIFMLDVHGNIASWNPGAQRAKGYSAEEIVGKHFSTFYLPDAVAAGHPQHELEVALAEGRYEEEGWRVRKDGSVFWANVVITAIKDAAGQHLGFAKVTRDVTERRAMLQSLEKAAAERAQVLAITAHELRSPLSIVAGFIATLEDHWPDLGESEKVEMVQAARRGATRLQLLVNDLLTSARLESGVVDVNPTTFDISELVREVATDLGGASVAVHAPKPIVVIGDRDRAQQMLGNYLTNALRYGAAPITVSGVEDDGFGKVTVADRGDGVDEHLVPNLFAKFSSGGSHDAIGLGLFIVRELARAQGGEAWHSRSDNVTTFGFSLPLATPTAPRRG